MRLGDRGLKEIMVHGALKEMHMGAFCFLKLEIEPLKSVLTSSEADACLGGWRPGPAQKKSFYPQR